MSVGHLSVQWARDVGLSEHLWQLRERVKGSIIQKSEVVKKFRPKGLPNRLIFARTTLGLGRSSSQA